MHGPFVPFSILFTRAVQLLDVADLARIDHFAASLQPETTWPESITHPYRLYRLLCRGARLCFDLHTPYSPADPIVNPNLPDSSSGLDFVNFGMEAVAATTGTAEASGAHTGQLSDWYYGNQQIMSLLEDDIMF